MVSYKNILTLLFIFFLLAIPLVEAKKPSEVHNPTTYLEGDDYKDGEYTVSIYNDTKTKWKEPNIKWTKKNNTNLFWAEVTDDLKYDADGMLKDPLSEIHFLIEPSITTEYKTTKPNQYYTINSHKEINFDTFIAKNNITSQNITPIYYNSNWEGFWEIFMSMEWGTFGDFQNFMRTPYAYRYSFYGSIFDLDPEINLVYSSTSDVVFANKTEATAFGLRSRTPVFNMEFNKPIENGYYVQDNSLNNIFGNVAGDPIHNTSCVSATGTGCYQFDAIGDQIYTNTTPITAYPFTYATWVRTNVVSNDYIISMGYTASSDIYYSLGVTSGGVARLSVRNTVVRDCDGSITINDGEWHYIVAVLNSSTDRKLYVDGVEDGTGDCTGTTTFSASVDRVAVAVQADSTPSNRFLGEIDVAQIYDFAITETEIIAINNSPSSVGKYFDNADFRSLVFHNSTSTLWNITLNVADSNSTAKVKALCDSDTDCISYYPLDDSQGASNVYADAKGNNDGTPKSNPNNATGLSSDAIRFDGIDDYISLPAGVDVNNNSFTLNAWFNTPTTKTDNQYIVEFSYAASGLPFISLNLNSPAEGSISGAIRADGGGIVSINSAQNVNDGKWHMASLTRNQNNVSLYFDGNVVNSGTAAFDDVTLDNFSIGLRGYPPGPGGYFEGQIDEVMIYNSSLDLEGISNLYKAGLTQHANANISLETRTATSYNTSDTGLVSFWALNNNSVLGESATIVSDLAGNNNGSVINAIWDKNNGTVGGGYYFDGTGDFINVSDGGNLNFPTASEDFTVSTWIRTNVASTHQGIVTKADSNNDFWRVHLWNDNKITCSLDSIDFDSAVNSITAGFWYHVVCVFDRDGNGEIYINGLLSGTPTALSSEVLDITSPNLIIGGYEYTSLQQFNGSIDEVRVYNRTLSATEIADLYNLGDNHIEWNDWSSEAVANDNTPVNSTEGNFLQFKANFNTNDTRSIPYLQNHSVLSVSVSEPTLNIRQTLVHANTDVYTTRWQEMENGCVDPNGKYHVAYEGLSNDLQYANSTDGGMTWTTREVFAGTVQQVGILCHADATNLTIYWTNSGNLYTRTSGDSGGSWSGDNQLTSGQGIDNGACALDANDDIHCALAQGTVGAKYYNFSSGVIETVNDNQNDDSDFCDIEIDVDTGEIYVVCVGTDGEDVDVWSPALNGWGDANRVQIYSGNIVGTHTQGYGVALDIADSNLYTVHKNNGGMIYCESPAADPSGSANNCSIPIPNPAFHGDIAIGANGLKTITYSNESDTTGSVFLVDSVNGSEWRSTHVNTSLGHTSIIDNSYPLQTRQNNEVRFFATGPNNLYYFNYSFFEFVEQVNVAPSIDSNSISIVGATNLTTQDINGTVTASDTNGDAITIDYNWYKDDVLNATTLLEDDNLVLYYPFDNNVLDYIGSNDGEIVGGTVANTSGAVNGAYTFDGVDGAIHTPDNASLNIGSGEFTWGAWVKVQDTGGVSYIMTKEDQSSAPMIEFVLDASNRPDIYIADAGYTNDANAISINAVTIGEWAYVTAVRNTTSLGVYLNGDLEHSVDSTAVGSLDSSANLTISSYSAASNFFNGSIDEVVIYNRSLLPSEIKTLYRGGLAGGKDLSSTLTTAGDNWTLGARPADYELWGDEVNSTETINIIGVPAVINTSINAVKLDVPDFTYDSTTYVVIKTIQFNTSINGENFSITHDMNLQRTLLGSGTSNPYVNISVDGVQVVEQELSSVSRTGGSNPIKASGIPQSNFSVSIFGAHNLTIEYKRLGNTFPVSVSNIVTTLNKFTTNNGGLTDFDNEMITGSTTSTSFVEIQNFTTTKTGNSSDYHLVHFSLTADATTTAVCRFRRDDGLLSPHIVRTVATAADTGTAQLPFVDTSTQAHNTTLECLSTTGANLNINGSFFEQDLVDNNTHKVNSFQMSNNNTNYTNTITVGAGLNLLTNTTYTFNGDGDGMLISASVSFDSDTGSVTPNFILNSTLDENNCRTTKERASSGDVGNVFMTFICSNAPSNGDVHNITLWVDVPAGEQLEIYDESLAGYETKSFDTATINTPPTVVITAPSDLEVVNGTVPINFTYSDSQGDSYLVNITANNGVSTIDIQTNLPNGTTNGSWSTNSLLNGYWNITVTAYEDATPDLFSGNATVQVLVSNAMPDLTVYAPLNTTYGSTDVDLNVTASHPSGIDSYWYSLDGAANVTFTPNITFATAGFGVYHDIIVYVNDTTGGVSYEQRRFFVGEVPDTEFLTLYPLPSRFPYTKLGDNLDFTLK